MVAEGDKPNMGSMRYSIRVQLHTAGSFFGNGVADLLMLVDGTRSLSKACELMNMSYSKGWRIIKYAEKELGFSLLRSRTGGANGGGSEVTEEGRRFTECYLSFRDELKSCGDVLFEKNFSNYL